MIIELSEEMYEFEASVLKLDKINDQGQYQTFTIEDRDQFQNINTDNFFSESEKAYLAGSYINKLKVLS